MQGNSRLAENPLAPHEELCFVELA